MEWITSCFFVGSLFLACLVSYSYGVLQHILTDSATWGSISKDVLLCLPMLVLSAVLLDIARLKPSRHHTFKSLLSQYILIKKLPFLAFFSKRRIHIAVNQIRKVQEALLLEILHHNGSTQYGRDRNFNEIRGVEDFRILQPFTDYTDYEVYIDNILKGQDNVLFQEKVDFLATSSGTTSGKSKLYPMSLKAKKHQFADTWVLNRDRITSFQNMDNLKFWHKVTIHPQSTRSSSGIPQNALSSFVGSLFPFYASPPVVYKVDSEPDALYLHALFGIRNEDVIFLEFVTSPVALNFVRTIENNWESLCTDLEQGTLNRNINIDPSLRLQVEKELHIDTDRARHLRGIFTEGFHDLIPRIWPACTIVMAAGTGSFSFATETMRRHYLGNVRLFSPMHVASEGIYGMNVDLTSTEVRYTILPSLNFYEFIPATDIDSPAPRAVLADEVEVGGKYELVLTTSSGLYRYRTADIVKVTGFQSQTPSYEFIQRAGDVLSVNMDKYPEWLFTEAVTAAAETWTSGSLLNYIATENIHVERVTGETSGTAGCYYVFIELLEEGCKLSQKEKLQIDECLKDRQEKYFNHRIIRHSLNPPVVIQVECGSIQHIRDIHMRENTLAVKTQYKYPRFFRKPAVLQYLISHQIE